MSVDTPEPHQRPPRFDRQSSRASKSPIPDRSQKLWEGLGASSSATEVQKNENNVIKRTVEFALLIKTLVPDQFPNESDSRLEALRPEVESRLAAIEHQRRRIRGELDQLAKSLSQVTDSFKKLELDQDELTGLLGQEGLDDRS